MSTRKVDMSATKPRIHSPIRRFFLKGLTILFFFTACEVNQDDYDNANNDKPTTRSSDLNSFLFKFAADATDEEKQSFVNKMERKGGTVTVYRNILDGQIGMVNLKNAGNEIGPYHEGIERIEPNYIVQANNVPNDPLFENLYGLHYPKEFGVDISAVDAWDITTGSKNVVVGVVDTGVDYTHPDLEANMWINMAEAHGTEGVDDDDNGYIDDIHGINAIRDVDEMEKGDPMDDHSHGTHVAGTIGAVGNNGIGVVGVNWNVSIVALKSLNKNGSGYYSDAILCFDYAVGLKKKGVDLRVLNNSWAGTYHSQILKFAISSLSEEGILFVAAAGNDWKTNTDYSPRYPSSYDLPNIISVAATDTNDQLAYFSNFGPKSVDIGAPGVKILSTVLDGEYEAYSGTSMATPHVAGAAALLLSYNNELTVDELKTELLESGDPVPELMNKTVSGKRLNINNALRNLTNASFRIYPDQNYLNVAKGNSVTYTAKTLGLNDYKGPVAFSVSSSTMNDATMTFSKEQVTAGDSNELTIKTTADTPLGKHYVTIQAAGDGSTTTRNVTLHVLPKEFEHKDYQGQTEGPMDIPDIDFEGLSTTIDIADNAIIEDMEIKLDITHSNIEDLYITLTSPSGNTETLYKGLREIPDSIKLWALQGEELKGTWTLNIVDGVRGNVGQLNGWSIDVDAVFYGSAPKDYQSDDTPITIPDNDVQGIESIIYVPYPSQIGKIEVSVNITHTYIGDLILTLRHPSGEEKVLHKHEGSSTKNLIKTYFDITDFNEMTAEGDWTLIVKDTWARDVGTLNNWKLTITEAAELVAEETKPLQ